jgi:crotonobetainyl-CoA:carnitine CoA-transferase CaiB-like acyl-CoA transferase
MSEGALAGVRVVELGHGIAGPFAARLLADLGADVIKVEEPGAGDFARRLEPLVVDRAGTESSALFEYLNWNKRSVALDLRTDEGSAAARRLIGGADVVVESFRPGRVEGWGLGQAALRAANPALVVTSVSNFGHDGPCADWLGSDLVFQALSGVLQMSGTSDREPLKRGLRQSLYAAGLTAAYASIAAHYASLESGAGAHVDVSIHECLASEIVLNEAYYMSMGAVQGRRPPRRDPLGGPLGGGDPIPCADGYVALQISGVVSVADLAGLLGEPRLAGPEFATSEARLEHADELNALLARRLEHERGRDFFLRASESGYLTGVVQGARELLECSQLRARGVFHSFPDLPGLEFPAVLAQLSRTPTAVRRRAPRLGEHTEEVLAERREPKATPAPARNGKPAAPLAGLRVLDLSYVFATPYLGGLLADLGAEVIKLEAPHRLDQTRSSFSPFFENDPGEEFWDRAGVFHVVNRGKRSLSLDLGREEGRDVLRELVRRSDVLLENFTPRVMWKWGLTYDELAALNPALVMLSNTGYGSTGPWAGFRAQGTTLEATMGVSHYAGYAGGVPAKVGQSYPDFLACWTGLTAVLAALVHRRRTGEGQWIDVGIYQLGAAMVVDALVRRQANGDDSQRSGSEDIDAILSGVLPARGEDRWVAVSAGSERELEALRATVPGTDAPARADALKALARWAAGRDAREAAATLQAAGVPAGAVLDQRDLLADPHLRARGFHEWIDCGRGIERPIIGRPYRWTSEASSVAIRGCGPDFGEAADYVLRDVLSLEDDAIAALIEQGVVTTAPTSPAPVQPLDLDVMVRNGALARVDVDYLRLHGSPLPEPAGGGRR